MGEMSESIFQAQPKTPPLIYFLRVFQFGRFPPF